MPYAFAFVLITALIAVFSVIYAAQQVAGSFQ
jgi:hypothetical protein